MEGEWRMLCVVAPRTIRGRLLAALAMVGLDGNYGPDPRSLVPLENQRNQ
jgi:hypothetical protein